jgi:predicted RNA-binding protein
MTKQFKDFMQNLIEARGFIKSFGNEAERHKAKYLNPYVGSETPTHEVGTAHESLPAGSKVKIHSVYKGNDNKNYAVVSGEDKKEINIPVSKLHKPGEEQVNLGTKYESDFVERMRKHGLVPENFTAAGSTAGADVMVINKKKKTVHPGKVMGENNVFQGEVKQDVTAAMGQLTIRHNKEKGWHIPEDARSKRPKYAAEIEKAGILEHMNKAVPEPTKVETTASGRAKNIVIEHPDLSPADAYLQDHHAHFVQVGSGFGTYKVGEKDETGHGLPSLRGKGKWTIREKQAGNKSSRTVMFQPNGKKGLEKSNVNLDNDEHLNAFKRTLGHLDMEKTKTLKKPYEVKIHG